MSDELQILAVVLSLSGSLLNARQHRAGFVLWILANLALSALAIKVGTPFLIVAYTANVILAGYGYWYWTNRQAKA